MANIQNSSKDYSAASSTRLATAGNDVMVGFDDDLLAIKDKLFGETRSLQIIPIVGMGGIGKTTLARNAFHDPLIKESFHIGGWVTVSQSYNLQQILTTLKESLKESFDGKQPEEEEAGKEGHQYQFVMAKGRRPLPLQKSQKVHFQESQQEIVLEEETHKYAADFHEECTDPATAACEEHDETNVLESHKPFDGKQPEEEEAGKEGHRFSRANLLSSKMPRHLLQKSQKVDFQVSQPVIVLEKETHKYAADFHEECTEPATATCEEHDETNLLESHKPFDGKQPEEEAEKEGHQFFMAKGRRPLPRAKRPKHLLQKSQKVHFQESQQEIVLEEETHKYAADFHEECTDPATAACEEHDETNVLESHKPFDGKQLEEDRESEELNPKRRPMNRKQAFVRNARAILQKSQTGNLKQSLKDAKGLEEGHESQKVVPEEETREYRAEFFEECCEYATEQSEEVDEIKVLESAARTLKQSLKPFKAKRLEEAQGSEELEFEPKKRPMTMKAKAMRLKPVQLIKFLEPLDAKRLEDDHESQNVVTEEIEEYGAERCAEEIEVRDLLFEESPESTSDQVYKTLKGRKYLIVMDDIWSTEVCDHLKRIFPDDDNGSRVILTTRLQDVATYAKDCRPHEMTLMQEDQSWDLLRQKVATCTHELEDIGKAIAKSCGGLPLAIVVIAGLLSTVDRTRASWEEIKDKVNSTVSAKDGQLEKILSFSYMDLPHHLRQCFVYMGGFPEDSEIPVTKLVKLWIAEGFIGGTTASKSLEDKAEDCLKDLIKRSLVLVGRKKPHGEIKSCSLHDLMRDLCVRKAHEEKVPLHKSVDGTLVERLKVGCSEDVRYLRVMEVGKDVLNPFPEGPELHAWIPEQIFRLSNLRYLVLAYFVEIPAAVSYLENLQTFIIYAMEGLVRLPPEIWTMPQLRHLVSSFEPLPCPKGESTCNSLENLQTLSEVSNLECTNTLVEMIPNIKKLRLLYSGSYEFEQDYHLDDLLCLNQLENLFNPTRDHDYHLENLERLQQLEKLKVRVYPGFQGILNPVFPQSLKKLSLSGWRLTSWKDMTIAGSLPNLQVLKLRGLRGQGEKWETIEGEFPRLTFLLIERSDLREWITEPEHFPNLKQLLLHSCCCLDEIPSEVGDIPTLELIEVEEGSTSLVASARRIEEEQKEMGNESLQVRCTEIRKWSVYSN